MSMPTQRFQAPTAREALALARATFGEETLILANRPIAGGVEVVAAAESDLAAAGPVAAAELRDAALAPIPIVIRPALAGGKVTSTLPPTPSRNLLAALRAPAMAAALKTAPATSAALPSDLQADVPRSLAPQGTVQADTEQLAMSTLSFQDYVRERMLRRQHEGSANDSAKAGAAGNAGHPANSLHGIALSMPAASVTLSTKPIPATKAASVPMPHRAADANMLAARGPDQATGPLAPAVDDIRLAHETDAEPDARTTSAAGDGAPLLAELHAMRQLMEDRFSALAWIGQARQSPLHTNLMHKLIRAGYSSMLARQVLEPMQDVSDPKQALKNAIVSIEALLQIDTTGPSLVEQGGVFALIGATGVGKTTTCAKLTAQCVAAHGAASVGLVTLDTHRVGAHDQLRAYAAGLGVVAHVAHDRAALKELLGLLANKRLVLIDNAGIAPRDPRRPKLLNMLALPRVTRLLVLNAGAHGDTLDDVAKSFKIGGASQAILTKIDEAAKLGPVLDVLIRHQLTLRGVCNGQRIPEDWIEPSAAALVTASMQGAARSRFDPDNNDLPFHFSPAACSYASHTAGVA